jgi:ACT domain-containing protein
MHQQVRTSPSKRDAPGAMSRPGSVLDILQILSEADVNLQTAGGRDLDRGGDFVFAVHHDEGDDQPDREAAAILEKHGYRPRVVNVDVCNVADEPGGLLGCLQRIQERDGDIYELFVGTPDQRGNIPVQVTTRRAVTGDEYNQENRAS